MKRVPTKGFTLIEMVVTMAIVGIVGVAIVTFQRDLYFFKSVFDGNLTVSNDARYILRSVTNEIRSASPSSNGGYTLEEVNPQSFTFYSDTNSDGVKERIRYFLSGMNLKRGVIIPTGNPYVYASANEKIETVVSGVSNGATPIFQYYDANYDGTTGPLTAPVSVLAVRLVKITLQLTASTRATPVHMTVTTQITIRNLKDNL